MMQLVQGLLIQYIIQKQWLHLLTSHGRSLLSMEWCFFVQLSQCGAWQHSFHDCKHLKQFWHKFGYWLGAFILAATDFAFASL